MAAKTMTKNIAIMLFWVIYLIGKRILFFCWKLSRFFFIDGCNDSEESPKDYEDSDTEFEDDVVITIEPNKTSSSNAEENRINLEKSLGAKEFIKAYPIIEVTFKTAFTSFYKHFKFCNFVILRN